MLIGHKWRSHRKLIAPTFHLNVLKSFIDLFNENSRQVVKKLELEIGKTFDAHDHMSEATVEILLGKFNLHQFYVLPITLSITFLSSHLHSLFSSSTIFCALHVTVDEWKLTQRMNLLCRKSKKKKLNRRSQLNYFAWCAFMRAQRGKHTQTRVRNDRKSVVELCLCHFQVMFFHTNFFCTKLFIATRVIFSFS